jgi:hypothetical protein
MTDSDKKYSFPTEFKLCFAEIFAKGKTGRAISYRDNGSDEGQDAGDSSPQFLILSRKYYIQNILKIGVPWLGEMNRLQKRMR